jgi:EmrB/QacA subfamily drug resistance transporter
MAAAPAATAKVAPKSNVPVLAGLLLGVLLAALDQTIVATAIPTVVRDLGGIDRYTWLFAAYMLGSTVVIPIAGKLSDLYGRRPIYLVGMGVFLLGSALCGTATTMDQLILYRAVQGLGGGAIFPVAIATIADLYPPAERGRVGGLFGAVFGLSSVVGPFLGGSIVDYVHLFGVDSWRWIFYVNVPVGALGIFMVASFFPRTGTRSTAPIDFAGIATLTTALVSALLVAVAVEEGYAWTSGAVLGLAALALVAFGAFLWAERRAADPIIPLRLFRNPIFAVASVVAVFGGAAMFTVVSFMPTYLQGVVGISATYSGTALIPLSLGIVAGSVSSGILVKRFGYKAFIVGGFAIAAVGYLLLASMTRDPEVWKAVAEMAVLGVGVGFTIQTLILAPQNAVGRRDVGAATSSITLFRTLGATFGVTLLGIAFNRRLSDEIPQRVDPGLVQGLLANELIAGKMARITQVLIQPELRDRLPPDAVEGIKAAFSEAMAVIFLAGAAIAAVALLISVFLKSIPMKTAEEYNAKPEDGAPSMGH